MTTNEIYTNGNDVRKRGMILSRGGAGEGGVLAADIAKACVKAFPDNIRRALRMQNELWELAREATGIEKSTKTLADVREKIAREEN